MREGHACKEGAARQVPLITMQRSTLQTLTDQWPKMNESERKRMIVDLFASVTASAAGIARTEMHEEWKPCLAAALPRAVALTLPQRDPAGLSSAREPTARLPYPRRAL